MKPTIAVALVGFTLLGGCAAPEPAQSRPKGQLRRLLLFEGLYVPEGTAV